MSNPVVLITGALTGIGRAAAVAFAKKGASGWKGRLHFFARKPLPRMCQTVCAQAEE